MRARSTLVYKAYATPQLPNSLVFSLRIQLLCCFCHLLPPQLPPAPLHTMSDTEEELEVVPDSQIIDSSMISASAPTSQHVGRTNSGKRRRVDTDLPEEDEEDEPGSQMSAVERGTMDEHLSCGICLSILENPFMVLPCMHSYDRECLAEWWKR